MVEYKIETFFKDGKSSYYTYRTNALRFARIQAKATFLITKHNGENVDRVTISTASGKFKAAYHGCGKWEMVSA